MMGSDNMATKAIKPSVQDAYPLPIITCGACGGYIATALRYRASYCSDCGKKVDWTGFPTVQTPPGVYEEFYDWRRLIK